MDSDQEDRGSEVQAGTPTRCPRRERLRYEASRVRVAYLVGGMYRGRLVTRAEYEAALRVERLLAA